MKLHAQLNLILLGARWEEYWHSSNKNLKKFVPGKNHLNINFASENIFATKISPGIQVYRHRKGLVHGVWAWTAWADIYMFMNKLCSAGWMQYRLMAWAGVKIKYENFYWCEQNKTDFCLSKSTQKRLGVKKNYWQEKNGVTLKKLSKKNTAVKKFITFLMEQKKRQKKSQHKINCTGKKLFNQIVKNTNKIKNKNRINNSIFNPMKMPAHSIVLALVIYSVVEFFTSFQCLPMFLEKLAVVGDLGLSPVVDALQTISTSSTHIWIK